MAANIIELAALAPTLRRFDRLLGIDLGTKTIGIAISDVERRLASPVTTIRRTRFTHDAAALIKQAGQLDVVAMVIGLPLNMDGTEGPRVQATRAFIRGMASLSPLPFIFWDERLSTAAVTRTLIEQDASRAKRAAVVDRMAAAYILQGALDRLAHLARTAPIDASQP
jgi:putative Holliday junction resolvase